MTSIKVKDVAQPFSYDIDLESSLDVHVIDGHVRRCVAAATDALKKNSPRHSVMNRGHMASLLESMRGTHHAIRALIREAFEKPASVDALALARLQIEALYSVCLMVEDDSYVTMYLKHHWKALYVRWLLRREEVKNLSRFAEFVSVTGPEGMEAFRIASGVTEAERSTIENEELGVPLPPGTLQTPIRRFPTPGRAIQVVGDRDRKRMLMRMYFEYKYLCSFAHGSAQSVTFKVLLDDRSPYRHYLDQKKAGEMYSAEVTDLALTYSFLGVLQSMTEILTLYPADLELRVSVNAAWSVLMNSNVLGRAIWEMRSRETVGVIR